MSPARVFLTEITVYVPFQEYFSQGDFDRTGKRHRSNILNIWTKQCNY